MAQNTKLMCEYIAMCNNDDAINLCNNYGYDVDTNDVYHVAGTLQEIIAEGSDDDFKNVVSLHPDTELFKEMYGKKKKCNGCVDYPIGKKTYDRYQTFYANGGGSSNDSKDNSHKHLFSNMIAMQTNNILMIGLLLVGGALIYNSIKK